MVDTNDIFRDQHTIARAKDYLRQGGTVQFFEEVTSMLMTTKPDDPVAACLNLVVNPNESYANRAASAAPSSPSSDSAYALEKKLELSLFVCAPP